ncbi:MULTISPECIES: ScbR family autoregulator-binding transcription factor [unclassified Streptomyces]|uniref:ScbR family autoregulator-binding transcription factor n=1 Tax=unclassified Streptomyces TaxID=2593676 RepID=UPI00366445AC
MAKQDRAIRTRQTILTAAAKVFEERGYQAATIAEILNTAGVTKGALYFHFESKEQLAQGVLHEQDQQTPIPARTCKLQELADEVLLHAYRLQHDPMVRAAVRLTMDQHAQGLDRTGPFLHWSRICRHLLETARSQGELLPHVNPTTTADVIVGTFAGIQSMSQTLTDYRDLTQRTTALLQHLLPSITHPSILATLDLTEQRGHHIYNETRNDHPQPTATH